MEWIRNKYKLQIKAREGEKKKSLPVVLLATAKQQSYIVKLTNLVSLQIWIHTPWFVFTLAYEITNNRKKKKLKKKKKKTFSTSAFSIADIDADIVFIIIIFPCQHLVCHLRYFCQLTDGKDENNTR